MIIEKLYDKWIRFIEERKRNPFMQQTNPNFITMRKREKMIHQLFKEIKRMLNVEKNSS